MNKNVAESSISNESVSQSDECTTFQPQSCEEVKECGGQTEASSRTEESDAPDREAISPESAVQGLTKSDAPDREAISHESTVQGLTVAGYTCLTECDAEAGASEDSSSISDDAAFSSGHCSQSSTVAGYTCLTESDAEAVASEDSSSNSDAATILSGPLSQSSTKSDAADGEAISLESPVQGLTGGQILPCFLGPSTSKALEPCSIVAESYTFLAKSDAEAVASEESSSNSDVETVLSGPYSQSSTGIDSLRLLFLENKVLRATIDEQIKAIKNILSNYKTFPDNEETITPSANISTENENVDNLTIMASSQESPGQFSTKLPNVAFLEQQNVLMKAMLKEQRNALESMLTSFKKVTEDNIRVMAETKDQSEQIEDNETVTITVGVVDYLILMEVTTQDIKRVITKAEHVQNVVAETFKIAQFLKSDTEYIMPDLRSIRKQAYQLKKLDELYISYALGKLLTCINGVAMYVPRISVIVSNARANFTECTVASSNFENEVENMFKKLKKAHLCFNGIKKILKLSRAGALDGLDIIMTEISETITTFAEEIRNFAESFHLPIELASYLYDRGGEITSLNYTATEVVRDQLERRTDVPVKETIIHLKTISNEMWTTVEQIIAGAKTLISKLTESKETANFLLSQSKNIHKELNKMQEYISEITRISENARHQHDDPPIAGIGQENRTIRVLQQENRELKLTLEEYQNALDMIMSKYRQHVTKLAGSSQIDLSKSYNKKYSEIIIQQAYKIKEMADVMHKAVQLDDDEALTIKEEIQRLVTENKELRELLSISTNLQQYASLDEDDTQQD